MSLKVGDAHSGADESLSREESVPELTSRGRTTPNQAKAFNALNSGLPLETWHTFVLGENIPELVLAELNELFVDP
jgi:hypothetical protein